MSAIKYCEHTWPRVGAHTKSSEWMRPHHKGSFHVHPLVCGWNPEDKVMEASKGWQNAFQYQLPNYRPPIKTKVLGNPMDSHHVSCLLCSWYKSAEIS